MIDYKTIKTELKKQYSNTKYFTRDFYRDYLQAVKKTLENIKNNIDDSYRPAGQYNYVTLFHSFDPVYTSKFYIDNGSCYCIFLEIMNKYNCIA